MDRLLDAEESSLKPRQWAARGRAYRQVLSLLLALRQPTRDLVHHEDLLESQVDRYLRALAHDGVISTRLRDAALQGRHNFRLRLHQRVPESFIANKGPNAVRMALLPMLGIDSTYSLDRLDLTVRTTLDERSQSSVSEFLEGLSDQGCGQCGRPESIPVAGSRESAIRHLQRDAV